jgi:hypothetical protein
MWTRLATVGALLCAVSACAEVSGPAEPGQPLPVRQDTTRSCQENRICEVPAGDGSGLVIGGITPRLCTRDLAFDHDGDGFADHCEYQIARAFRPLLSFALQETQQSRESYWAALYVTPGGVATVSVMYLLAYHQDGGSLSAGAHRGDSEFLIVDVVWSGSAWKVDQVFMSAHWRSLSGVSDRSDIYDWRELQYWEVVRGRPVVVVSHAKHANYNNVSRCTLSVETACAMPGVLEEVDVLPDRNVGSSALPLLDCVQSVTPDVYPGTECFWTGRYFDGWQAVSDFTPGYREGLAFFEARPGFSRLLPLPG